MDVRSLSLRWRMILTIVVLPLLVLMPVFFIAGGQFRQVYRDARLGKGEMITRQLEQTVNSVAPYVTSIRDVPGLDVYLRESIKGQPELAFAALVHDNGYVVYHSNPGESDRRIAQLDDLPDEGFIRRELAIYGDVHLVVRALPLPGSAEGQLFAVVGEFSDIVDPPWLPWLPAVGSLILAALLVVLMEVFVRRSILMPLEKLAEGAAIVGAGDLAYKIGIQGSDEIGFVARAFNDMASRLRDLVTTLEQQVAGRTADLEQRRRQLEAVALVSRDASRIRDVPLLLEATVMAIAKQFDMYHVGIFLLDETRSWAVMRAASSAGGRRMLARGHRLRVGRQGIVGSVAEIGKPRIALDVGTDAVWFDTPELPDTHSEIALPLFNIEQEVIGVLDVQSAAIEAFFSDDVETLQLLADQISVALQNALLLERTQSALMELEALQQDYSRQGWARVLSRRRPQAYEYDSVTVQPVLPLPTPADLVETSGASFVMEAGTPLLVEPMHYRDQTIGLIALSDPGRVWSEEEVSLVRSVTDQVATALENARLFEEAQRTARQQALLNLVLQTAAMATDPDKALSEIAGILAQGLGMAVGVFTFTNARELDLMAAQPDQSVKLQAFTLPSGENLLSPGKVYELEPDLRIFFHGLVEPELGKMLPGVKAPGLESEFDLERVLYVPIRTATTRAGFMALLQREQDVLLDPETRVLARNLAGQVAVVLENMNLLEEAQQRSVQLQAALAETEILYEAGAALNIAQTYAEILDVMRMYTLLGDDSVDVALQFYDHPWTETEHPNLVSTLARWSMLDTTLLSDRYYWDDFPTVASLLQPDRPWVIEDLETLAPSDTLRRLLFERLATRAAVFMPLVVAGQGIGFINAHYKTSRRFSEAELRRLTTLGAQAAVAVQNMFQLEATAARARREQLIREIGEQIQAAPDVQGVLQTATRALGRALGTPRTVIRIGGLGDKKRPGTGDLPVRGTGALVDPGEASSGDEG